MRIFLILLILISNLFAEVKILNADSNSRMTHIHVIAGGYRECFVFFISGTGYKEGVISQTIIYDSFACCCNGGDIK